MNRINDCKNLQSQNICKIKDYQKCIGKDCPDYQTKFIKLNVSCQGDRSVGIWGEDTEVLIERKFIDGGYGDDCREFIKEKITDIFKELFDDGSTSCRFEDECWNCGKIKTECKCKDCED
jgi:hypothetical protein